MRDSSHGISTFSAPPAESRRTLALGLVPESLLKNDFLNQMIASSLPKNYNFEIHKTIWKIKQVQARCVILQFPEGLMSFGPVLVDILAAYFDQFESDSVDFIIMGDLTYGACCIDDFLASSLACDLVVHYAHSCLVPINELKSEVKYLYIFLDIKFDLSHIIDCVEHNFDPSENRISLASTIQFVASVHELARHLKKANFQVSLPQSKPLSSGEILGCTAPKLANDINTVVFVCDGRFHLEALMIANPHVSFYRYDPYSRKLTKESYAHGDMLKFRSHAINKTSQAMQRGSTIGFVLGTLGRQGSEKVFDRLVRDANCNFVKVLMPEVSQTNLSQFKSIAAWVQVACPRLSIDWGSFFDVPLLNPFEYTRAVKFDQSISSYPMDYYAKFSGGSYTPNHKCGSTDCCGDKELSIR